jgi:hypothetical protein
MQRNLALQVILDTKGILDIAEPVDGQLRMMGLTVKHLCEYAIATWSSFDSSWANHYFDGSPLKRLIHNAECDLLSSEVFRREGTETRSQIYLMIVGILTHIYMLVDAVITQLNLNEYQISTLIARQWVGRSLILEINA